MSFLYDLSLSVHPLPTLTFSCAAFLPSPSLLQSSSLPSSTQTDYEYDKTLHNIQYLQASANTVRLLHCSLPLLLYGSASVHRVSIATRDRRPLNPQHSKIWDYIIMTIAEVHYHLYFIFLFYLMWHYLDGWMQMASHSLPAIACDFKQILCICLNCYCHAVKCY